MKIINFLYFIDKGKQNAIHLQIKSLQWKMLYRPSFLIISKRLLI